MNILNGKPWIYTTSCSTHQNGNGREITPIHCELLNLSRFILVESRLSEMHFYYQHILLHCRHCVSGCQIHGHGINVIEIPGNWHAGVKSPWIRIWGTHSPGSIGVLFLQMAIETLIQTILSANLLWLSSMQVIVYICIVQKTYKYQLHHHHSSVCQSTPLWVNYSLFGLSWIEMYFAFDRSLRG